MASKESERYYQIFSATPHGITVNEGSKVDKLTRAAISVRRNHHVVKFSYVLDCISISMASMKSLIS